MKNKTVALERVSWFTSSKSVVDKENTCVPGLVNGMSTQARARHPFSIRKLSVILLNHISLFPRESLCPPPPLPFHFFFSPSHPPISRFFSFFATIFVFAILCSFVRTNFIEVLMDHSWILHGYWNDPVHTIWNRREENFNRESYDRQSLWRFPSTYTTGLG